MKYVKAPDFPTGGIIYGMEGVKAGYAYWPWQGSASWQNVM